MKILLFLPVHLFDYLMGMIPVTIFGFKFLPISKLTYAPSSELIRKDEERIRNTARRLAYEVKRDFYD